MPFERRYYAKFGIITPFERRYYAFFGIITPFERRYYPFFRIIICLLKGVVTLFSHLSQRLTTCAFSIPIKPASVHPSVRRSSICPSSSTISNIFFSKTTGPVIAKLHVEPLWVGGTEVCSWHLGHMTKVAAKPIYGKNSSKIFSRTSGLISTKLGL